MFTATQSSTQWLFPISALENTPTEWTLQKELYDRARGVEFLFRLGSSLQLYVVIDQVSLPDSVTQRP